MSFAFLRFVSRGLEHSMKSWFEKDVNIVNWKDTSVIVKPNLLQIMLAVDLLIHLTSDQVCPNPPALGTEIVTNLDFNFGQFNLIGN